MLLTNYFNFLGLFDDCITFKIYSYQKSKGQKGAKKKAVELCKKECDETKEKDTEDLPKAAKEFKKKSIKKKFEKWIKKNNELDCQKLIDKIMELRDQMPSNQ